MRFAWMLAFASVVIGCNVDTTSNGAVTLKGEVETTAAKERAEQLARNTRGVREVTNLLVVKNA